IESSVRANGYDLLVHFVNMAASETNPRPRPLSEHNTDGMLIFTDNVSDAEIKRLYRQNVPLVLLFRSAPEGLAIPTVNIDNVSGTSAAMDHLILRCGRRR